MTGRALLGLLAFVALMLVLGWTLLACAGVARTRRELLRAAGLALFLGWAATGLCVTFELILGLHANTWEVVTGQGLIAAVAAATLRLVGPKPETPHVRHERSLVAWASGIVLGAYLAGLLADSLVPRGIGNAEAWSQWLIKAKVIYFFGLDTGVGGYTQQQNGTYPPLDSALESTAWHFAGKPDFLVLPLLHWIVFIAFLASAVYLLAPRVRPLYLWPPLAVLTLAPSLSYFVGSSLGEELVAEFLGLAVVLSALWVLENETRWLVLACPFYAAASWTKNEGLVMAVILTLLFAIAARRRAGLLPFAGIVAVEVPWKIWQHGHNVPATFAYDWGRLLHPHALAARFDYVTYGARSLLGQLFAPGHWLVIVPIVLVLGLAMARRRNPLALVALGFPILSFVAFEVTYWAGKDICQWSPGQRCDGTWHDIVWLVGLSADRLPLYFVVITGMLLPLLLNEASPPVAKRR
jgi:hypothetical protein